MASYLTPGVYVEEVPGGARPIRMVGTSTAAFLGVAPKVNAHKYTAVACMNWTQFVTEFVGEDGVSNALALSVFGFYQNGGGRCYIVNIGNDGNIAEGAVLLESLDEITIVCAPGHSTAIETDALISHCELLGDRVAVLDSPSGRIDIDLLKKVPSSADASPPDGLRPRASDSGYGAFYYPWVQVKDPLSGSKIVSAPPSGFIAGVYSRTDSLRGVHKAPANETVRGAVGLDHMITGEEQGELNRAGVNVIRYFSDSGFRVWGARTLAPEASEWRYVNVRRLLNMIKESIEDGTRWTVFEPNDMTLWKSVERNIRAFLYLLWRDKALQGETEEQAFYVKCDAETNPPEVIDSGRLVTEIGLAPVKPAEFVIFRLSMLRPDENDAE